MIGYLSGKILEKETDSLIVKVGGIGYKVFVPFFVWKRCRLGSKKEFFVHTWVREDQISLFGFLDKESKKIFVLLTSVSGIGPKLALSVVSCAQGADDVVKAIQQADVDFFTAIKGLGKKSAQRIIVDLKSKIGGVKDLELEMAEDEELIQALRGLGFSSQEIKKSIKGVKANLPLEKKIRLALRDK